MAGAHAGMSIIEKLWEQAVAQYDKLMDLHTVSAVTAEGLADMLEDGQAAPATEDAGHIVAYLQTQGKLQGICYALAVMLNPYEINLEDVKAQVRDQWTALQEIEDEEG
jgi:hypothetical protein